MIRPLTTNRRRAIARASLTLCAVSLPLLPLALPPQSSAGATSEVHDVAPPLPSVPPPLSYPALTIRRDPFVRPTMPAVDDGAGLPPDFVLPANAGISSTPRVLAVILGTNPKALVDIDGRPIVVSVGTLLEGAAVVGIDAGGLTLENGERLPFSEPHQ